MLNDKYYPESLKNLPIWALWRIETDQKGRPTKVPYSPHYDGKASSTNPKTWGTFKQAEWKYKSVFLRYYETDSVIESRS